MNYIDVIISISLLYGLIKGYSNGIVREITNIISLFLAIYVGIHFSELIHPYLKIDFLNDYSNVIPLLAFLMVFVVILVIIKSLGELVNRLTKILALGLISRFTGGVFGIIKLLVICVFVFTIANNYSLIDEETKKKSILFEPLQKFQQKISPEIVKHKKNIMKATKEKTQSAKESLDKKINQE